MVLNGFSIKPVTEIPEDAVISAVIGVVYDKAGQLLAVKNPRGWDFPGGHVKPGETPEGALRREVLEEASAMLHNPRLFMSATADQTMLFYVAKVNQLLDFRAGHETTDRIFLPPSEFLSQYGGGMPEMAKHAVTLGAKLF